MVSYGFKVRNGFRPSTVALVQNGFGNSGGGALAPRSPEIRDPRRVHRELQVQDGRDDLRHRQGVAQLLALKENPPAPDGAAVDPSAKKIISGTTRWSPLG